MLFTRFKVRTSDKERKHPLYATLKLFAQSSPIIYHTLLYGVLAMWFLINIFSLLKDLSFFQGWAGARAYTNFPELTVHVPLKLVIQ